MAEALFQAVYDTILTRETKYDGRYYVGIITTGIVCRPSCRSRTPKPENVKVYSSLEEALHAGFRPCKRCHPDNPSRHGPDAELAHAVTKLMEQQFQLNLTLAYMAATLKMSPYHLQRVYKRVTGTTPARRLQHIRLDRAKALLDEGERTAADIAVAVGFRSASHFSQLFHKTIGCTPQEYREREC